MSDAQGSKAKKRRIKIHEATHENDIRYIGPLSYQHFQMLGWLCIAVMQVAVVLKLGGRLNAQFSADTEGTVLALQKVAEFSLPFLLIANFAQILDASESYARQLVRNFAAMAGVCGLFYLVYYRYLVGGIAAFLRDPGQALPTVESMMGEALRFGFMDFNIFVDLLLCTMVMMFLNYRPKRVFKGKLVLLFRLFTLLPIAYEVGCMALKIRAAHGEIYLPAWVYPLLTVKPPMTFVLFVVLALYVKTRELRFRRHGRTHEEYKAFLKTRRNSWHFSVFLAIMMVVVSALDFGAVVGFSIGDGLKSFSDSQVVAEARDGVEAAEAAAVIEDEVDATGAVTETAEGVDGAGKAAEGAEAAGDAAMDEKDLGSALEAYFSSDEGNTAMERSVTTSLAVGFGGSISLALLAPLVLLFSYTRVPKRRWISLLIPAVGILLILAIYIEGFHQLLFIMPIEKIDINEAREYIEMLSLMAMY